MKNTISISTKRKMKSVSSSFSLTEDTRRRILNIRKDIAIAKIVKQQTAVRFVSSHYTEFDKDTRLYLRKVKDNTAWRPFDNNNSKRIISVSKLIKPNNHNNNTATTTTCTTNIQTPLIEAEMPLFEVVDFILIN